MWQGPTIPMEIMYPFGALPASPNQTKHLIRKKIANNDTQLQKARIQAHLKHDCLIKLQSAQEQKEEYYLLFEYVPVAVQQWYRDVTREFIQNYEQRLILFSRYLADRNIITSFRKQNMGVSSGGDAKYYLDPSFEVEKGIDKYALKKRYKEQIRSILQQFLDTKTVMKQTENRVQIPQKKQNSKLMKILDAIEKGKANLMTNKQKSSITQQKTIDTNKTIMRSPKNVQNIINQKETIRVNKIQVMVNNKPVEVVQQEFRREYASSSFYINGMPTVIVEKEGQTRRLLSPNDKFARFQEVKYKEYKSLKGSGEFYVQDFINVLEENDHERPGSPKNNFRGSPRQSAIGSPKHQPQMSTTPLQPAIKQDEKKVTKKEQIKHIGSPRGHKPRENVFMSEKVVKNVGLQGSGEGEQRGGNKANDLQKKVSQAIANSLNAINKFKSSKNGV